MRRTVLLLVVLTLLGGVVAMGPARAEEPVTTWCVPQELANQTWRYGVRECNPVYGPGPVGPADATFALVSAINPLNPCPIQEGGGCVNYEGRAIGGDGPDPTNWTFRMRAKYGWHGCMEMMHVTSWSLQEDGTGDTLSGDGSSAITTTGPVTGTWALRVTGGTGRFTGASDGLGYGAAPPQRLMFGSPPSLVNPDYLYCPYAPQHWAGHLRLEFTVP